MKKENLPLINLGDSVKDIIQIISDRKTGLAIVVNDNGIIGIVTDGDIRRAMEGKQEQFFSLRAEDLISLNPKVVDSKAKLIDVQKIMTKHKVNSLLVIEDKNLVGVIQIYDLGI